MKANAKAVAPLISFVTHGRNDGYMGDFIWRLATCLDKIAANYATLGHLDEIEILVADWGGHLGPLHEKIALSEAARKVTRFAVVSPETAAAYNGDGVYSYAAGANVALRRARGQFVFSMDSDAFMPLETAEMLWRTARGEFAQDVDLNRSFFWLSRKHVPYQFVAESPTTARLDDFILNREKELITTAKCNLETFRGGAVAIFAKKELFAAIHGYDERLIYWGWCDIDIHYRLALGFKPYDFWDLGGRMYHLEHYPQRGNVVGDRKLNPQVIPTIAAVNTADWGLAHEAVALASYQEGGLNVISPYKWESTPVKATMNIVVSGTNYWNPGDDFVRDGVLQVLRQLFPERVLNLMFYNFNADFFPQDKFSGISNFASQGDLDQYREFVDAVVIAGLSAGDEIKDLYRWVIANGLQDRVYLIGAGYENNYVAQHIAQEPEATIFKNARIIVGRTEKTPEFIPSAGLRYVHLNCPALLSVQQVKAVPAGRKIEKIGFSIQLSHEAGLVNHSCAASQYQLAVDILLELSASYAVEVVAHHKTEYYHFLHLLKGRNIPVIFSSFYQDLHGIYPRYDLMITTRLHASLFANGHGIPGIIINDTDRHTHTLAGFPHSSWVNTKAAFYREFAKVEALDLAKVAMEAKAFKTDLTAKYVAALAEPFARPLAKPMVNDPLPVHFLTIVVNGKPFIEHHLAVFKQLPFEWHWHVVEGVADLKHDTAWSKELGGRISNEIHAQGRSLDGTSEYLDEIARQFPNNITIYRKPLDTLWDGKLEMVNAPLGNIKTECLLWQVDADELWTVKQIATAREMFLRDSAKTAALYICHYFVGEQLVITTRDTYGNNTGYEWIRTWRYTPGCRWIAHEPPRLCRPSADGKWTDLATINPFRHAETEAAGLVFQHFAYATASQLSFKEVYYGYTGAVKQWQNLQAVRQFPARLAEYFAWVKDGALVDTTESQGVVPMAQKDLFGGWKFSTINDLAKAKIPGRQKILFVRTDSIGDNVLAASMLEPLRQRYPGAQIGVLCQEHISDIYAASPFVDAVICYEKTKALSDEAYQNQIIAEIAAFQPSLILNTVFSREALAEVLILSSGGAEIIGLEGDLANISAEDREQANKLYTRLIKTNANSKTELERHRDFMAGIGIETGDLLPQIWTTPQDEEVATEFFLENQLDPTHTIALFPGAQHDCKVYAHYAEALKGLGDYKFLILGGAEVAGLGDQISAQLPNACINLAGKTTLREMAALIRRCRLYVGADSAGAHLACAVGVPNVVVLGGGHFGRFFPYSSLTSVACLPLECFGCSWACRFERPHCVKDVSPQVIAEAVRGSLAGLSPRPRLFVQASSAWQPEVNAPKWQGVEKFIAPGKVEIIAVDANGQPMKNAQPAANDLASAREELKRAVAEEPQSLEIQDALGMVEFQMGELASALSRFEAATKLDPTHTTSFVKLAMVALRLERIEVFEAALGRALQLDPNHVEALQVVANLNLQAGRFADAAKGYARILAQKPGDLDAMLALGRCHFENGEFATAAAVFENALKFAPENQLAQENLKVVKDKIAKSALPAETGVVVEHSPLYFGEEPLVSVIVSTYNAERFIRQCLEDLVAQTVFEKLEVLVIDSGSQQNERDVVREFQQQHGNIVYVRTERETLYAAWNRGIKLARGKYVTNANSDDSHRPDALEIMVAALETNPEADLAYADYAWTSKPNDTFVDSEAYRIVRHPAYHPATALFFCILGCHPFWRRSVFDKVGLFEPTYFAIGDYEFLMRFVSAGCRAVLVPEVLSLFYQNPEGLTFKSNRSEQELPPVYTKYRKGTPIERLFKVDPAQPASVALGWTALGTMAMKCVVPWQDRVHQDVPYALFCFNEALRHDPRCVIALHNLIMVLALKEEPAMYEPLLEKLAPDHAAQLRAVIREQRYPLMPVDVAAAAESLEFRADKISARASFIATAASTPKNEKVVTMPVRWQAPFFNLSGYASEAVNFVVPIADQLNLGIAHQTSLYSDKFVLGLSAAERTQLLNLTIHHGRLSGGIVISHLPANGFVPCADAQYQIGRTMYETDRIPAEWVSRCNLMDEVWVPSEFNRATFAASGVEKDKLVVIPGAVDETMFNPDTVQPMELPNRAAYNFLAIFEWSSRKGWDVLLAAYLREFSAEDDVCLYLRVYLFGSPNEDPKDELNERIAEHIAKLNLGGKKLPRIELLTEQIGSDQLPGLYRAADCLVAPSRGEGWGRPQHEAMMMGLPVIATNWSGTTAFMKADNSYLLSYDLAEITQIEPNLKHYLGHCWAEPFEAELRQRMRALQRDPASGRATGQRARAHVLEHFSRPAVARMVMARLQIVEARIKEARCAAKAVSSLTVTPELAGQLEQSIKVAWEGSYLDLGSLSHVNRELTRQLGRQGRIQLQEVGKNTLSASQATNELREFARRIAAQAPRSTQVTVRHAWPPDWRAPANGAWVQIQPWEFGALPIEWVRQTAKVDEIWVYTEYVRRVYVDSGVAPAKVKVVPLGIDPQQFHPAAAPLPLATEKKFKFLFVGGTIRRKGPDLLLKAYLNTFTSADDVCLVIKDFGGQGVYAGQTFADEIRAAQEQPNAPEILYLTEEFSTEQIAGLYTACDCLVHPYRGEGFGLPVLEAMACGLPTVVTGGGSTDDFASDEFAYRLPARREMLGMSVGGFKLARPGWLLEPDLDALQKCLRWVMVHREKAKAKGVAASEYVRREWTWERSAAIAAQRLQNLLTRKTAKVEIAVKATPVQLTAPQLHAVARLGNLTEAREALAKQDLLTAWNAALKAVQQRPFHPEGMLFLAEVARAAGNEPLSRTCAERARQMAPQWKQVKKFLKSAAGKAPTSSVNFPALPTLNKVPTLTVCMIVRNEEKFLPACLKSIQGLAQQIIVVDTGSTDRTVEIAKELGAEVHFFAWNDDFSAARNAALAHATGDWVLSLDADEELLPESREKLAGEMQAATVMAYRLPIADVEREADGVNYVPRLFRNAPGIHFAGRIHEQAFGQVEILRKEWGLENKLSVATLLHHGYSAEMTRNRRKVERNLRLLEQELAATPGDPNLLMNYGLELIRSGEPKLGISQYLAAFEVVSRQDAAEVAPELRETLLTQLCTHLLGARDFDKIIHVLGSMLATQGGLTASLHFLQGLARLEKGQYPEAAEQMRQCLAKRDLPVMSTIHKEVRGAAPNHCLAMCLTVMKQPAAAAKAFMAALADDPQSRPVRVDWAKHQWQQGQPVEALKTLNELVAEKLDDAGVWQMGGEIGLSQPEFLEFAVDWTSEACRNLPNEASLQLQRAEVLLLRGDVAGALPLWRRYHDPSSRRHLAALAICELSADVKSRPQTGATEKAVSQEFLKWYRQLLNCGAQTVVEQLNGRLGELQLVLPTAAEILRTAMEEAEQLATAG